MTPMTSVALIRLLRCALVVVLLGAGWPVVHAASSDVVRVKDLGKLKGWRDNALFGTGIVTGLAGTGATLQADPRRRVIAWGGQDLIEVAYESAPGPGLPAFARFRNLAFGYALDLRSAASE